MSEHDCAHCRVPTPTPPRFQQTLNWVRSTDPQQFARNNLSNKQMSESAGQRSPLQVVSFVTVATFVFIFETGDYPS